jgi:hypothetical protein
MKKNCVHKKYKHSLRRVVLTEFTTVQSVLTLSTFRSNILLMSSGSYRNSNKQTTKQQAEWCLKTECSVKVNQTARVHIPKESHAVNSIH